MKIKRKIGPKGQVVIPKEIREKLGLRSGVEVIVELRGKEVVIRKAEPYEDSRDFIKYYVMTFAKKLDKPIDLKKIIEGEVEERYGIPRR